MDILDYLKILGGLGGFLGLALVGLFGLSKFRNSKLHSTFEKISETVNQNKGKIDQIDASIVKNEQAAKIVDQKIEQLDKEIEKVDKKENKQSTNENIIDMFDKLSKD